MSDEIKPGDILVVSRATNSITTEISLSGVALALLLGVCFLHLQADLMIPLWASSELLMFLPLCFFIFYYSPKQRFVTSFIIGYLWALLFAQVYLQNRLPVELVGEDIMVQGVVSGVPELSEKSVRFNLDVSQYELINNSQVLPSRHMPSKIRLSWYYHNKPVKAGDKWQLLVRLKQPHGVQNPGGFDYEKWLFQKGIQASGYIRKSKNNRIIETHGWSISSLRQGLLNHIAKLPDQRFQGILQALTLGHKSAISVEQWQVFRDTGTSHLMAISGLHIGLVAGLVFWGVRKFSPVFVLKYISAPQIAAVFSLSAAFCYAMLAGFTVPTQRAFIMLLVLMLAILLKRPAFSINTLSLSVMAVLLINPLSVLSAGFWLSYLAVLIITLVSASRFWGQQSRLTNWLKTVRVQWLIALGMLPVSLMLFQQGSLISPVANMLVIPMLALLVVPMALLASFLSLFSIDASLWLFAQTSNLLSIVWTVLEWLSTAELSSWYQSAVPLLHSALGLTGVALLLMPRGFPLRYFGVILLIPMLLYKVNKPVNDEFWLTVVDVGQGLSVLVQTKDKSLLYDAGAKFSDQFDMGQRVIVPYLNYVNVYQIDKFVISHADNDHAGGAESILNRVLVKQVYAEQALLNAEDYPEVSFSHCRAGDSWRWNGVNFLVLHPDNTASEQKYKKTNNRSCVLKVWNQHYSVLISGDIERKIETLLLSRSADKLAADVLVVPHHGSNTSSSVAWLKKVKPKLAIVSAGYKNRFHHPTPKVLARYHEINARVLNTAYEGAIQLKFTPNKDALFTNIRRHRKVEVHYWNHRF